MDAQRTYPQNRQSVNTGDRRFSLIFNRREFAEVMYWIKSQCPGGKMAELPEKWAGRNIFKPPTRRITSPNFSALEA